MEKQLSANSLAYFIAGPNAQKAADGAANDGGYAKRTGAPERGYIPAQRSANKDKYVDKRFTAHALNFTLFQ
jgi:hypothetical protein